MRAFAAESIPKEYRGEQAEEASVEGACVGVARGGVAGIDSCDGVDGSGGVLCSADEGDARREQRAGGVLAGIDGRAVENYGAGVVVLRGELEIVGGGTLAGYGGGGGGSAVDGEEEG